MSKTIYKAQEAEKNVLEYKPPKLELGTPVPAHDYLERKAKGSSFRMSDVIRVQTGVEKIESTSVEDQVEQRVLDKLQTIQEAAYQEAYQLGLEEGRKLALQQSSKEIDDRLKKMELLIHSIKEIKQELVQQNESHIVQLAFHMAKRLAYLEVSANPEVVINVIRDAIQMAQVEEEVQVQVAPEQLEFLEALKKETDREHEFLKKVKFEPVQGFTAGGCVIETNYGEIDARFEERVNKLWEAVKESIPRVKNKVTAA